MSLKQPGRWFVLGVIILGTGCQKQPPPVPLPPAGVSVSQPLQQPVTESIEYTGSTEALETVDVRARVRGFLKSIEFTPRQKVEAGVLLFVIDPQPFEVALERAKAALDARKGELQFAVFEKERIDALGDSATQREKADALSKLSSATAGVAEAQAAVDEAKLNLDYAHVKAPISGRIGRNMVDVGNLIGAGDAPLATITNDSFIYGYFNVSEQDLLRLRGRYGPPKEPIKLNELPQTRPADRPPVFLGLMNENGYPHEGWVDYVDPRLDPGTGTISVRAVFPNSDGAILPGMFARIKVPIGEPRNALLVVERALGMDQGQRYVLVVNNENKVEYRRVRVGLLQDGLRVIDEGLSKDDWVIVLGLQRVRPGTKVHPERVSMDSLPMPTSSPSATRPTAAKAQH